MFSFNFFNQNIFQIWPFKRNISTANTWKIKCITENDLIFWHFISISDLFYGTVLPILLYPMMLLEWINFMLRSNHLPNKFIYPFGSKHIQASHKWRFLWVELTYVQRPISHSLQGWQVDKSGITDRGKLSEGCMGLWFCKRTKS